MSRRRSSSSVMGPPPDRDVVMGPPPLPLPSSATQQKAKDSPDIVEKYRKLKRRFFELEEKHKETSTELQRSGERNVKMREERNFLLDRIIELESQPQAQLKPNGSSSASPPLAMPLPQPSSSAFPRTLLNARARTSFIANLRQAVVEDDADEDLDPLLTSRHVGPLARKRSEEGRRERLEEDARDTSKSPRKNRGTSQQGAAGSGNKSKEASGSTSGQPLLTFSPSAHHVGPGVQGSPHSSGGGAPVLVASTGARLRIKPPAPPAPPSSERGTSPDAHHMVPSSSSNRHISSHRQSPLPSTHSHPHSYTHPPPPPPPHFQQPQISSPSHQYPHPYPSIRSSSPENSMMIAQHDGYNHPQSPVGGGGMELDDDDGSGRGPYSPLPSTALYPSNGSVTPPNFGNRNGGERNGDWDSNIEDANPRTNAETNSPAHRLKNEGLISILTSHGGSATPPKNNNQAHSEGTVPFAHMEEDDVRLSLSESATVTARDERASTAELVRERYESPNPLSGPSSDKPPNDTPPATSPRISSIARSETTDAPSVDNKIGTPTHDVEVASTFGPGSPHNHNVTPVPPASPRVQGNHASLEEAQTKPQDVNAEPGPVESEDNVSAQNDTTTMANSDSTSPDPAENTTSSTSMTTRQNNSSTNQSVTSTNPTETSPPPSTSNVSSPTQSNPPVSINPYSMYYPSPTAPLMSNAAYPHPYANPYYPYHPMGGPIPGPSGLYAPSPNFVPPSAQRPPSEVQRHAKPKRLKAHTVTSKSFSIPMVPRDKKGKPMLPLNVGIMTVINLGDVCMREHFHTERYIFPVGYEVTRRYLSTIDANIEVVYHCTILDGGDGPKFQIVPSDVPDRPVIAGTATGAWSNIVKQANAIRNRQHSNSVSGPDFFGLGQNTIKHLIQELAGADRLRDYVWQIFVEGGPLGGRHAAVIPALPEEYDASMPIGAYYPSERDKMKREPTAAPESPRVSSHYPQHILAQAQPTQAQSLQQQGQQTQPLQPGVTQIVLPPPTTSEMLNIQEYQPPPQPEKRNTRNSSNAAASGSGSNSVGGGSSQSPLSTRGRRKTSHSPNIRGEQQGHTRHTRSNSRSQALAQSLPTHHSPYLANANAPASSSSPPPVPATFASIMNAYPPPSNSASPRPTTGVNGGGSGANE